MASSRLKSRRRQDQGFKWARVAVAILSTIGVIDTGSITLSKWGLIGPLTCPGGQSGCQQVLNSPWGTIFESNRISIPLSFLGLVTYIAVLCMAIGPLLPGLSKNKIEFSRMTWWGLFITSCIMTVFSMLLIGLMIFKIQAFCLFCIISGILSISILILTIIGGGWEDPRELIFRGILISLSVLLGGSIWASSVNSSTANKPLLERSIPPQVISRSTQSSIELAAHLTETGARMYSAYWCPHCHDQKEMFGKEAVTKLKVIECAKDGQNSETKLCEMKGINGYPSWEINGEITSGVQSLESLAEASQYFGNRDF